MTSTNKGATNKGKRTPARPHRRLDLETIDSRITKLQKRLDHAKTQITDAERHVEGYMKEKHYRDEEMLDKEKADSEEGAEKPEKTEKTEKVEKVEKGEKVEKTEKVERQLEPAPVDAPSHAIM